MAIVSDQSWVCCPCNASGICADKHIDKSVFYGCYEVRILVVSWFHAVCEGAVVT